MHTAHDQHRLLVIGTSWQWYDYAVPILASVGSVIVGSLAAVFISSKTETLGAWLSSLNGGKPHCEQSQTAVGAVKRHQQEHLSPEKRLTDNVIGRGPADVEMTTTPLQVGAAATTTTTLVAASRDGGYRSAGLVGRGDRVLLAMVLAFSLLFAYLSSLVGSSDLLGCFLGGLAFSGVPDVERVWTRQVHIGVRWFVVLPAFWFSIGGESWTMSWCYHTPLGVRLDPSTPTVRRPARGLALHKLKATIHQC